MYLPACHTRSAVRTLLASLALSTALCPAARDRHPAAGARGGVGRFDLHRGAAAAGGPRRPRGLGAGGRALGGLDHPGGRPVRHAEQLHRRPAAGIRGAAGAPSTGGGGRARPGPGAAPDGRHGLRVFDGYRPVRATLAMVDWAERTGRRALLDSGYIARRSRHNHGGRGGPDAGGPGHRAPRCRWGRRSTPSPRPRTPPTRRAGCGGTGRSWCGRWRRKGFANYDQEWWHFSYPVEGAVPFDRVIR